MIDHMLGRPSNSWRRAQVILIIVFWTWRILHGDPNGPRLFWLKRANRLLKRFTPWQLIVSTLTGVYAVRNIDKIVGLGAPDPLENLYSASYYRAVWVATGLDAGFATAMTVRPKWLRDICSVLFSLYYIVYATEAQEKLRRYRAVPTVEMLRTCWEKTTNPYIRALTHLPQCTVARKILLPRPRDSVYQRPVTAWLYFAGSAHELALASDLILDIPGGGFVAMSPQHHEERLRMWAVRSGKPVLAIDYGKAPEYPYPFAIDEVFDVYRVLVESNGRLLGMNSSGRMRRLAVVLSGDSAGATIAVNVLLKLLEGAGQRALPLPAAAALSYAALDFNFASWMRAADLRVLRAEQSAHHLRAREAAPGAGASPLAMVGERRAPALRRRRTWRDAPVRSRCPSPSPGAETDEEPGSAVSESPSMCAPLSQATLAAHQAAQAAGERAVAPLGTRMTMTSRTGYFQDKIITPSMMRAMALLYIGPARNPDFATDYHVSPVLAPAELLARFPPLLMQCGERDPFVDDTVLFAGRVREAKRARRHELAQRLASAGPSARFGEGLRMSAAGAEADDVRALRAEHARLVAEDEDDWVRMTIYEDWSHGYLQMVSLLPEAREVINDIADWMTHTFANARAGTPTLRRAGSPVAAAAAADSGAGEAAVSDTDTDTDADTPIFLVPRRGSARRPSFAHARTGSTSTARRSPPGSDTTLVSEPPAPAPAKHARLDAPAPTKRLTETELLQRRRMLDAHMFE